CLASGEASAVCVEMEQRRDGSNHGRLEVTSAPLDLFARLGGLPLGFSQAIDGAVNWSVPANAKPSANAAFQISGGALVDRLENLELLKTRPGTFRFDIESGALKSGELDVPFDGGTLDIDFEIPDILAGQASALQGRIIANLDDLDVLTIFSPDLVQTDGELRAVLLVEGTVADPRLSGVIELINGRTTVLAAGMRLREARLTGRLDDRNHFNVTGTFRAGDGLAEITADIDATDPLRPSMELFIKGEGLTLIDVPDLRLQANTDIRANWSGELLTLAGRIHVPEARFAPSYLPSETAVESPDVVIVAGAPEQEQSPSREMNLRILGELEVSLGDQVVVDLDVAKADLTGSAVFKWDGPPIPLASGQYDLEGEIQAYGQTLEITKAEVRFPDVPANNPHLDVRAERRIYGNPQISHAGVLVHGTLKRPVTEAYTVPPTNADRARALLITGSDFNYEQGTGAVSVGTYISPKLYLAYGVGLFEEGNVITVRYDLKRNFGVKATSGQDDTGIDFSYTIER
ncbi:MAG: translocation/assembly module TamB domain-containing protein, partial [Xanthomonadales bacterium]|nr:translocation/assembly module TamB domain-containing protein [Xanthomonadales bacterium]